MRKRLPNIILIIMDTVGAAHMSLYGYHRKSTPNLERFAEECQIFTRCFAPGCWTIPSHGSIVTGLYPSQHGANERKFYLENDFQNLFNILKYSGYRLYGLSSNGLVSPVTGLCPQFDIFEDYGAHDSFLTEILQIFGNQAEDFINNYTTKSKLHKLAFLFGQLTKRDYRLFLALLKNMATNKLLHDPRLQRPSLNRLKYPLLKRFWPGPFINSSPYTGESFQKAIEIIGNNNNKQPYLLFLNLMEAHEIYSPPIEYRKFSSKNDQQPLSMTYFWGMENNGRKKRLLRRSVDLYDDAILYMDIKVSQFLQELKVSGKIDDTVVIVTSDHGEHFGEKDYFSHLGSLYNPLIWVPLIVCLPRSLGTPSVVSSPIGLLDIFSTLLDVADSPFPRPTTSISIFSDQRRQIATSMIVDGIYWQQCFKSLLNKSGIDEKKLFMRKYSLIFNNDKKVIKNEDGTLEFYDLNTDPSEKTNLAPSLPEHFLLELENILEMSQKEVNF